MSVFDQMDEIYKRRGMMEFSSMMTQNGRAYSTSYVETDIGNNDEIAFYTRNPSTHNTHYDIVIYFKATGLTEYRVNRDNTENTAGIDITPFNLCSAYEDGLQGDFRKTSTDTTGDYVPGTRIMENIIPGGTRSSKVGSSIIEGVSYRLCPGGDIFVELFNRSGGILDYMDVSQVIYETDDTFQNEIIKPE